MAKDQEGVLQQHLWTPWSGTLALTAVTQQQSWSLETSGDRNARVVINA